MNRFIFFTKTNWSEQPRIRHQLARLLASAGHKVIFFEKPSLPFRPSELAQSNELAIQFVSHSELVHNKLRFLPLTKSLNAQFTKHSIQKSLVNLCITNEDIVVNFNYDFYFLRDLFPSNKLITVINDDHISSAWSIAKPALTNSLKLTCSRSDEVLVLSTRLMEQVGNVCKPHLFLPWADCKYVTPVSSTKRNTLFFWGFINRKIDYEFVARLARHLAQEYPEIKLLFVGPIESEAIRSVNALRREKNLQFLDASSLDQLKLNEFLGSIIPYRTNDPELDAIMMPNKAMQIFAKGLPVFITGMPDFIKLPFVFKLDTPECGNLFLNVRNKFDLLQQDMQNYVELNSSTQRLVQFMNIVNS